MSFRLSLALLLVFGFLLPSRAQQSSSTPQAIQLLQSALVALTGTTLIKDVTLTGTARRVAGSDDETGAVTFKALAGTGSRLDLNLSSGTLSEIRNDAGNDPAGSWNGTDNVSHRIAYHNLLTNVSLFPAFTLEKFASSSQTVVTYIGAETRNEVKATHLRVYEHHPVNSEIANVMQHLTQVDIFLDATTNLPISITFNTHPNNDAGLDIPMQVQFSDYRLLNGAQVPFHIQKFLNDGLIFDLHLDTVTLNSRIPESDFAVPAGL